MKNSIRTLVYIYISLFVTLQSATVQARAGVHYGRCKNNRVSEGFCRLISDCLTISAGQKSDANLIQDLTCTNFVKKDLICCPTNAEALLSSSRQTQTQTISSASVLPKPPNCGKVIPDNKIFGGEETAMDEFPWMVILGYTGKNSDSLCGGTIITEQFVLTAAHCVHERNIKNVRLGEWNTETNPDFQQDRFGNRDYADPYIEVPVQFIVQHPEFRASGVYENDIALLQLGEPVRFTDWIRPICLPTPAIATADANALAGKELQIAGWGRHENSFAASKRMLKASVTGWSKQACQAIFSQTKLHERQICAGNTTGTCRGDSGGPMMQRKQRTMYQVGVISLGGNCRAENLPAIFTKVDAYVNWIVEVISKGSDGQLDEKNGHYVLNIL